MSDSPYSRIRDARAEIVAAALSSAYQLITESILDVTAIRMVNNDEGSIYWTYRTDGDMIEVQDEVTPDGLSLYDELYNATSGLDLNWLEQFEPYLLTPADPKAYGYGPSMPVNKYDGEFEHVDLDMTKIAIAYQPYEKGYNENLKAIVLVYSDEQGGLHEQPMGDINDVGTLIDPESGDDMELVGWKWA